jgi:peptidoglycan/LPS O-acetylase OafA/YrhL
MRVSKSGYFPSLGGLRVIAASMIFLSHYWQRFPLDSSLLKQVFIEFHVGVSIFFVLSGFLIGYRYFNSYEYSWKWCKEFWIKRIIRIYPLYLILLVVAMMAVQSNNLDWFLNISLLKGLFSSYKFSGIAPAWALTVEMMFYLFVPVIFYWWEKNSWRKMTIGFFAVGVLLVAIGENIVFYSFFDSFKFMSLYTFFGRSFEFLIGVWLGIKMLSKSKNRSGHPIKTTVGLSLTTLSLYGMVLLQSISADGVGLLHPVGFLLNNYGFAIGAMFLIWGLIAEHTLLSRLLSFKAFHLLGKSSYAFFLMHYTVVVAWVSKVVGNDYFVVFASIWALSVMAYLLIEQPLTNMLTKKWAN